MAKDDPRLLDLARATDILSPKAGPWPAIVDSYDPATGQAVVLTTPRVREYASEKVYEPSPISVPVVWFGSASVAIDTELVQGDEVLLIPCAPSIRAWLTQGGLTDGTGPGRSLGDSVAFPVRLSGPRRPGAPGVRLRVGDSSGSGAVLINVDAGGEVRVQAASVSLGAEVSPKKPVGRDGDNTLAGAALFAWGTALAGATGVPNPWTQGVTPVGALQATSTEVESS